MKKINGKVLFGVGAGLLATMVGACWLFKKKNSDEDYVEDEVCYDEEEDTEVDESVETEED